MSVTVRLTPSAPWLARSCRTEVRIESAWRSGARREFHSAPHREPQSRANQSCRTRLPGIRRVSWRRRLGIRVFFDSEPLHPGAHELIEERGEPASLAAGDRIARRPTPGCNAHRRRSGAVSPRATDAARARSPPKSLRMSTRPLQNAANKKVDCRHKQGRRYRTLNEVT